MSAERRTRAIVSQMEQHKIAALKPIQMRLLAWLMVTATLALGAAIWWLVRT